MSTLSRLIESVARDNAQLAADIRREVRALEERREFGLNFERHTPETVELPGRPIRRGDKVRFLPERRVAEAIDGRLWRVERVDRPTSTAHLLAIDEPSQKAQRAVEDLVVIAQFRDPIYPGLSSTGRLERGGDKPFHTVINAENFHALQTLLFTHEGKVDAIYIDPPYNTRDKDWKYNNDYVDADDIYRHSKWLAFMERRLKLAQRLLNPERSALIVTIDEKEYLRLGLLLEQTFPEASIQMVTSMISAKGAVRRGKFSRVEEHIYFVTFGDAAIQPWTTNMLPTYTGDDEQGTSVDEEGEEPLQSIDWLLLRRREPGSIRTSRPNQFYPIFIAQNSGQLYSIGDPIDDDVDRHSVPTPLGTTALWPLKPDGTEMLWGLTPDVLRRNWSNGFARVNWKPTKQTGTVYYLPSGTIERIRSGAITITGHDDDGSVLGHVTPESSTLTPPKRVWNMRSHNAETGGTSLLSKLIPGRTFPYPKSLYAVEDALRFVTASNKDAVVLDFFAGSGTTAHAVMRLNRQDDGRRRSITITNNEVSAEEAANMRTKGLRPGDTEWERLGICEHITKPRLEAALTGTAADGKPIGGRGSQYRFTDTFPLADGFEENIEFFTLSYESPLAIAHNRAFTAIAPLLWMRAGAAGTRIEDASSDFAIADIYGVLFDMDSSHDFLAALAQHEGVRMTFIVTDDDRAYQMVCSELPERIEAVRLYESYLTNFAINTGKE